MLELSRVLYKKSHSYMENGECEKAIVYLLNAIKEDSDFIDAYLDLSYCYAIIDDFEEAEYYCDLALEKNIQEVDVLLMLAFVYHRFELFDEEIDTLNRVLNLGVDDDILVDTFLNLGNAYYEKNDMDRAIDYYKKAIRLEPESLEAFVNLGNAYFANEEFRKSIEAYKVALQLDPEDSNIYSNLGVAYIELGDKNEAIKYLTQAIMLNPHNESAHYNLGILYAMNDESDKAIEQYDKLLELGSEMAPTLLKILDLKEKFSYDRL